MIFLFLLFGLLTHLAVAFRCGPAILPPSTPRHRRGRGLSIGSIISNSRDLAAVALAGSGDSNHSNDVGSDAALTVKAAKLDESLGLTSDERNVVNVHRVCKDSVVYVTSVLTSAGGGGGSRGGESVGRARSRRRKRRGRGDKSPSGDDDSKDTRQKRQKLPKGRSLGSGSGFVIDAEGYIVTNYHVVQSAYQANRAVRNYDGFWSGLAANATRRLRDSAPGADAPIVNGLEKVINGTVSAVSGIDPSPGGDPQLPARVFVRFGTNGDGDGASSGAPYRPCAIVDVVEELDVAVLKMDDAPPSLKSLSYGRSSDLLVGQSLLAIGNPFGLDRTLSSGLVSALGRSVRGVAGNDIKNCIQTDAAINPGNSGGPLLNLNGEVIGVNTMIVSTSGSNAGIGFAVPGDSVRESTDGILEKDKERRLRAARRRGRGWLGAKVATSPSLEASFARRLPASAGGDGGVGAFLTSVAADSPLRRSPDSGDDGGAIETTEVVDGEIRLGDRIVNVGGNPIANGREFVGAMKTRVEGEQLSLTCEDPHGEKRVVYITLGRVPL